MKFTSTNGKEYILIKSYIKFANKEPRPIYYFKTKDAINPKIHHETELPEGWGISENPKGYPVIRREFKSERTNL